MKNLMVGFRRVHCAEPRRPFKFAIGVYRGGWHFWCPFAWTRRFYRHEQDWTP